jgi:hypothetical protein
VSTKPSDQAPARSSVSVERPISVSEFCRLLGISRARYYFKAKEGALPRALPGGIPRVKAQAVLDAKAANAVKAADAARLPSTEPA